MCTQECGICFTKLLSYCENGSGQYCSEKHLTKTFTNAVSQLFLDLLALVSFVIVVHLLLQKFVIRSLLTIECDFGLQSVVMVIEFMFATYPSFIC